MKDRVWKCDKFPEWLQKTYHIKGSDFCEAQWDDEYFSSQPECNEKVLPIVAFYDRNDNQYESEPLCTINMNNAVEGNFDELCPQVDSILKSDQEGIIRFEISIDKFSHLTCPQSQSHNNFSKDQNLR